MRVLGVRIKPSMNGYSSFSQTKGGLVSEFHQLKSIQLKSILCRVYLILLNMLSTIYSKKVKNREQI